MGIKFSQLPIASSVASDDYIAVLDSSESVLKRTPINHASQGSAYGLSTTTEYGHTKIVDNLSQNSLTSGEALSSRQGNVIANDMGQVELTTTAAYAHAQGDYFILIGQFVKCIQAISVGDTINLGTNVEATSIGAVLGQLNSKIGSVDISSIGSTITGAIYNLDNSGKRFHITPSEGVTISSQGDRCIKCGNIVIISVFAIFDTPKSNRNIDIGTIPADYLPSFGVSLIGSAADSSRDIPLVVGMLSSGLVRIYNADSTARSEVKVLLVYPVISAWWSTTNSKIGSEDISNVAVSITGAISNLIYGQSLTTTSDLNSIKQLGTYRWSYAPVNAPDSTPNSLMFVTSYGRSAVGFVECTQLVFGNMQSDVHCKIYARVYRNDAWGVWRSITLATV